MGDKINNVQSMMSNPKQRNVYLMGVGIAFVTLVAGFFYATSGNDDGPKGAAQISKMPKVDAAPGSSESSLYNKKVAEANGKDADRALEEGKTFVPTPINNDALSSESPLDSLDKQIKAQKEAEAREQVEKQAQQAMNEQPVATQGSVDANQPVQPIVTPQAEVVQAPPQKPKKYGSDDDFLIMQAITGVTTIKASKAESDYLGQSKLTTSQNMAQQAVMPMGQVGAGSTVANKGHLIAKSGSILHAVLETGINSDEPSPVLAKIVSGELKGTRLIGTISVAGEKVIVRFNTAAVPEYPTSIRINSVAVDPATSRTGLATDVDRHHFLKYGVLLSAAFIGSYADAISNNNSTTTITPEGSVITTKGKMTTKDMTRQAGGAVGKELANDTRQRVQGLKPTITVDGGTPIGILIMEDLYSGQ